ncbi:MAG: hypothetical protein NVS4B9_16180 [Ktedonobacteraceae bacterium]
MMMGMMGMMFIGMLLCFAFIAAVIWFVVRLLNKKQTPMLPYIPQRENAYQTYEQGYQPPQPPAETYQEGGQQYSYPQSQQPQYEQPQAQYPQEMP